MKTTLAALTLLATPGLALAQTAPASQTTTPATAGTAAAGATTDVGPSVGATVYDTSGGTIGTITTMTAQTATIDTGTNKVAVPLTSLGKGPNGPRMAMTKAALDAAAGQSANASADQLKALLVAGTAVHANDGSTMLGTVKEADDQYVTVTTAKGDVRLPANGFASRPSGLIVGMTAAQFNAAVDQSVAASAATPAG